MQQPRVLTVGGGAAGLCAAISAARAGAAVTVLEAGPRVGRKVLASGNGRCNLTNVSAGPEAFNQPDFVAPILERYSCDEVLGFFAEMGLLTRADDEGRVYPMSNAAASVLDVLRLECARLDVDVRCDFEVTQVTPSAAGGFEVSGADGERVRTDAVVVATADGRPLADVGHAMVPTRPVLGPIRTEAGPIRGLSGVRVRCAATLLAGAAGDGVPLATERGELLFRDYGVSGIMIFDLSRALVPDCVISIDLLPDMDARAVGAMLARRCTGLAWRTSETFFSGMLHDRVARAVLRAAGVDASAPVSALPQARLAAVLKGFRLKVQGMGDASQSQVTRGGADVAEFDSSSLASRRIDGLFAAGEVLDVDGRSGGFNLHWAWASGIVAGESAARHATGGRDASTAGPRPEDRA